MTRERVLYSILIEFDIPVKLFRPIKICLTKPNGLKYGDASSPLLFNFA